MSRRYGTLLDCWDPDAEHHPVPTYPWRQAPEHLRTRRQLRAMGLQPARQPIAAQILRPRRRRPTEPLVGYLYDVRRAKPRKAPSARQLAAAAKATAARRICPECDRDAGYCLPKTAPLYGECLDCAAKAGRVDLGDAA
jgi:hypothetical protein